MSNKNIREKQELESLFFNPKYSRQAWKSLGQAIAMQPATQPIPVVDKDGNLTANSTIEQYSYSKLSDDLKLLCKTQRPPTELEMILHCQMVKARTDTSAAVFIRDTLGAKPIDESKVEAQINNPYESLSDEELELLQQLRDKKKQEELQRAMNDNPDALISTPRTMAIPMSETPTTCNTASDLETLASNHTEE